MGLIELFPVGFDFHMAALARLKVLGRGTNHRLSAAFSFSRRFSPPSFNSPAFIWWLLSRLLNEFPR